MNLIPLNDAELALVAEAAEIAARERPGDFGELARWLREEAGEAAAEAAREEAGYSAGSDD